jgi:hypothetical protein
MVMTVCLRVYVALEHRIRRALSEQGATFPNQKGKRIQNPMARWVFHYFMGIHVLCQVGQWPQVLNLTEEHGEKTTDALESPGGSFTVADSNAGVE